MNGDNTTEKFHKYIMELLSSVNNLGELTG
jgi:hypothetical protein